MNRINMDMIAGLPFTWYIPVSDYTGTPIDSTGDVFTAIMGTWGGTTVATFVTEYTTDDDGYDALSLTLDAATTLAIAPGVYRWDCTMLDAATNDTLPVAYGDISVTDYLSAA